MTNNQDAPSWLVADRLKQQSFAGMIAPSFAPGAQADYHSFVLWNWGPDLPTQVTVFDPNGRLRVVWFGIKCTTKAVVQVSPQAVTG